MVNARAWGIAPGYTDNRHNWVDTPPETEQLLLSAMGATDGGPPPSPVRFLSPGRTPDLSDAVELKLEDGSTARLAGELPDDVPFGYHQLVARDGSLVPLVVSPGVCFLPERRDLWTWAVQLYSVRSSASWGIGDFRDLQRLGRWARGLGADGLLLNPLHAVDPGPQEPSPYFPSSRCFRNPIYLACDGPRPAEAAGLNATEVIQRDPINAVKMRRLENEWRRKRTPLESIVDNDEVLVHFATFMTLAETHGAGWRKWPQEMQHPRSPAVTAFRQANGDRVAFHAWLQRCVEDQLYDAASEIGLIHDLAVGVAREGADAWIWQDVFAEGVTIGAPPDPFVLEGQNWGLPPFDPWKLRASGYEPFIRMVRAALSHAGARIDHVMGMFRLFWIPEDAPTAAGAYVAYPYRDLLDIVALESHRAGSYVIGEDLGTVEDRVRTELAARNMLSYRVMWFEDDPPERYPKLAFATMTNHDLPTTAGVWSGADEREMQTLGIPSDPAELRGIRDRLKRNAGIGEGENVEEVIVAAHETLGRAPSTVVSATLEDATGGLLRPNIPGTGTDLRPNWSLPLPATLEELEIAPIAHRIARSLRARREDFRPRYADLEEGRMHYVEHGDGPLVVLLHGFPDFWYSWREQIDPLARAGYRVVAPDMRGYNESFAPKESEAYSIDRLTSDVVQLVRHLGEKRATVVGHDWGAIVAWFLAMDRPDVVDRLGIINVPHPGRFLRGARDPLQILKSWYILFFQLPALPERFFSIRRYAVLRALFKRASVREGAFTEDDIERYVAAANRNSLRGPISYYRNYLRTNPLETTRSLTTIECPVQVLWGDKDSVIQKRLAEPPRKWVPNAEIVHLEDCGHWPHIDRPGEVNARLIRFFER